MIGQHFKNLGMLRSVIDLAKIMVENTTIVIYQDMEELVGVETNFESRLVDFKLPSCFSTKGRSGSGHRGEALQHGLAHNDVRPCRPREELRFLVAGRFGVLPEAGHQLDGISQAHC